MKLTIRNEKQSIDWPNLESCSDIKWCKPHLEVRTINQCWNLY